MSLECENTIMRTFVYVPSIILILCFYYAFVIFVIHKCYAHMSNNNNKENFLMQTFVYKPLLLLLFCLIHRILLYNFGLC